MTTDIPSTHRVFRLTTTRSVDDGLKLITEDVPKVGENDILVKVKATSLNQRDLMILHDEYPLPKVDGVIPVSDFVGIVVAKGKNVKDFDNGDIAMGNFQIYNYYGPALRTDDSLGGAIDGGLREYVSIAATSANKVPKNIGLSFEELATLPCAAVTAWNALYGNPGAPLIPGQTVLAIGTGGVSLLGLAIAKAAGARTIITSSSDEKLRKAKEDYGIDETINYVTHPNWSEEVLKLTDGRGVDVVLENGGSGTITQSIASIVPGGQVNIIGLIAPAKQEDMPDVGVLALAKCAVVRGILVGSKQLAEQLIRFLQQNHIKIAVDKKFKFEDSLEAYKYFASAKHVGKVVISFE